MLTGVLLHMIVTTHPIHTALHLQSMNTFCKNVTNPITLIDDVDNALPVDRAQIMRLAAGGRIKCRPVQINPHTVTGTKILAFDDIRPKLR